MLPISTYYQKTLWGYNHQRGLKLFQFSETKISPKGILFL